MNRIAKKWMIAVLGCALLLSSFSGCASGREYCEDIRISLESDQAEIIIREWSFLLGSGAEVYYKNDTTEVLLGTLPGGDDGFCPFKEGQYAVTVQDNQVTIEWNRFPTGDRESWEKKTFELPYD